MLNNIQNKVDVTLEIFKKAYKDYAPDGFLSDLDLEKRHQDNINEKQKLDLELQEREEKAADKLIQRQQYERQTHEELYANPDNPLHYYGKEENINIEVPSFSLSDKERYRRAKQLTADLARLDNSEQGFLDFFGRKTMSEKYSKLLTIEESAALAKEEGVDLKWDKPVTEGEVRFAIERNRLRKMMQTELSNLREDDFSGWQELCLMGAGMAGSMPLSELAITMGLSMFIPNVAVSALARTGIAGVKIQEASKVALAVNRAEKAARAYTNSMSKLLEAGSSKRALANATKNYRTEISGILSDVGLEGEALKASKNIRSTRKATEILREQANAYDGSQRFAYNLVSVMKGSSQLEGAGQVGLKTQMALGALDNTITSIPFLASSYLNSERNKTESYGYRDLIIEGLFAGALGLLIPIGAKGLRKTGDAITDLRKNIDNRKASELLRKKLSGVSSEDVNKSLDGLTEAMDEMSEQVPKQIMQLAQDMADTPLNNEEWALLFNTIVTHMVRGTQDIGLRISELVKQGLIKTPIFTHLDDSTRSLLKNLDNIANMTAEELNELKKLFKINTKKIKINEKSKAARSRIRSVNINGETGMMGRQSIDGLTESDAMQNAVDIYNANVHGDQSAYTRMQNKIDKYNEAAETLRAFVSAINKEDSGLKVKNVIDYRQATKEVLGKLLFGEEYDKVIELRRAIADAKAAGIKTDASDMLKAIEERVAEMDKGIKRKIAEIPDLHKAFYEPEGKQQLAVILKEISDDLSDIAQKNSDMLDTDNILNQQYKDLDSMVKAMVNSTLDTPGVISEIIQIPKITTKEYLEKAKDLLEHQKVRNEQASSWDATKKKLQDNGSFDEIQKAIATLESGQVKDNNGVIITPNIKNNINLVNAITKAITETIPKAKSVLLNTVLSDPVIRNNISDILSKDTGYETALELLWGNNSPIREILKRDVVSAIEKTTGIKLTDSNMLQALDDIMSNMSESLSKQLDELIEKTGDEGYSAIKKKATTSLDSAISNVTEEADNLRIKHQQKSEAQTKLDSENEISTDESSTMDQLNKDVEDAEAAVVDRTDKLVSEIEKEQKVAAVLETLFDPVFQAIEKELTIRQGMAYKHIDTVYNAVADMIANPNYADEAIVKIFSMTPYEMVGSGNNIEAISNMWGIHISQIEDTLRQKAKGTTATEKLLNGGTDLVDYMYSESNLDSIQHARLLLEYYEGDITKAKAAGANLNDSDFIVAETINEQVAKAREKNRKLGSTKTSLCSIEDSKKTRNYAYYLNETDTINVTNALRGFNAFVTGIQNSENKTILEEIAKQLERLNAKSKVDSRLGYFGFENLDLDGMFPSHGKPKTAMNSVRDLIMKGDWKAFSDMDKATLEDINLTLTHTMDSLMGTTGDKSVSGWVQRTLVGSTKGAKLGKGTYAKYLEDAEKSIKYKDIDTAVKAQKMFGYDNMKEQLRNDFSTIQREYAILSKVGHDPMGVVNSSLDIYKAIIHNRQAAGHYTTEAMKQHAMISPAKEAWVKSVALLACGLDDTPMSVGTRIAKMIQDFVTSPLLVNAGFKSLTDYAYQYQYMVQNGLNTSSNLLGWTDGIDKARRLLWSKDNEDLRRLAYYNLAISKGRFLDFLTQGEASGFRRKLSKEAGVLKHLEGASRTWSDFWLNKVGWVEPFSNMNRSAAALNIMHSLAADEFNIPLSDFTKRFGKRGEHLITLLERHNIDENSWDFLRQNCIKELRDHMSMLMGEEQKGIDKGFKLFFAENIANLSDEAIEKEMRRRGITDISARDIENFRDREFEKAALLIQASADEMTSLPTARTTATLQLGFSSKSGVGTLISSLLKFKSFGLAVNQIHHGRRIARYIDTTDEGTYATIMNRMFGIGSPDSFKETAKLWGDLAGFTTWIGLSEMAIQQGAGFFSGNYQGMFNEDGEFNALKVIDPIIGSMGFMGTFVDAALGFFDKGATRAGGVAIPAAPAISALGKPFKSVLDAWQSGETLEESWGYFVPSMAKAFLSDGLGLGKKVFFAPIYNEMIGNKIEELTLGADRYYKILRNREKEGYTMDRWGQRGGYNTDPFFGLFD